MDATHTCWLPKLAKNGSTWRCPTCGQGWVVRSFYNRHTLKHDPNWRMCE